MWDKKNFSLKPLPSHYKLRSKPLLPPPYQSKPSSYPCSHGVVVMRWEVFSASPVPPFGVVSYSVLLWRPLSNHLVYRLCSSVLVGRSFGSSWLVVVQICSGGLLRWCLCFQLPSRLPALVSLESLKVGGGDAILPCSVFQNPWGSVPFRCLWLFIVFNLCRSEQCSSLLCWRAVSVVVCNTIPSFSKDRVRACRVLFKRLWLGFSLDSRCCRRCCSDPCSLVASVLFFGSDILQWFGFDWLERVVYACSDLSEGVVVREFVCVGSQFIHRFIPQQMLTHHFLLFGFAPLSGFAG
jgi:hypothetical protein